MKEVIDHYFSGFRKGLFDNVYYFVNGMLRSGTASTWSVARSMTFDTKKDFKANEKRIQKLLRSPNFQIDDKMWRCYINLLFDAMKERNLLKDKDNLLIKVDYTTDRDDFLILSASVDFNGKTVPLYFSLRNYPKRKNQYDQKFMEAAFIKALRHILSKKYSYTIVADRGFGNNRFIKLLRENGFLCPNLE